MKPEETNVLITGGAGFIGINTADYFLRKGYKVTLLDNFSRKGTQRNVDWLKSKHDDFGLVRANLVYNHHNLDNAIKDADVVIHLAGQVAVTTSVTNPRNDFMINLMGTFNILEAIRNSPKRPLLIYSSTNKVYGEMQHASVVLRNDRYEYEHYPHGMDERQPLDFHSPYGSSKGASDQYVRDYHRIYGLDTVVFRQSCIYGTHQFGIEDQGWVAWFTIAAALDKPITIFGDGKQIRDVLYVEDLARLYELSVQKRKVVSGKIYNIGGGPKNTMSLLELLDHLRKKTGKKIPVDFADWRPGDQKVFVADIGKVKKELGWEPKFSVEKGVDVLSTWVLENAELFKDL